MDEIGVGKVRTVCFSPVRMANEHTERRKRAQLGPGFLAQFTTNGVQLQLSGLKCATRVISVAVIEPYYKAHFTHERDNSDIGDQRFIKIAR